MTLRRWLLPLATLAGIGAVVAWEFASSRTGPGKLHPAHAELDGLFGASCNSCHRAAMGIDPDGCIRCHEPIGRQRAAATGLHGSLSRRELDDCAHCHSEHHGSDTLLIAPQAFVNAGIVDVDAYDHRHVPDWKLTGAHLALACDRCHPAAKSASVPPNGRFLGSYQACVACHEDVHQTAFGADCAKCHGQEQPFRQAPDFRHEIFPLRAAHARVACNDCHAEGTERSTAALSRHPLKSRGCPDCHEDPHRAGPGRPARALLLADSKDCSRCHESTAWSDARVTPAEHEKFGFPLRGGHARAECVTCHGDATHPSRHGPPRARVESCARCHQHEHAREFVATAIAAHGPADGCGGCHGDADPDFRHGKLTPAQHAVTGFLLDRPHDAVACEKCHTGATRAERFPGRKGTDCRACHRDEHGGQFDDEPRYAQCTACHQPTAFAPNVFGVEAHAATAFPLTGAHDAVACNKCHQKPAKGPRAFHGTAQLCADCHEDVHRGGFDQPGRPRAIDGRTGCARCHDTAAFVPVRTTTFDHGKWTGYPLEGGHERVECAKCHVRPDRDRRRHLGRVPGKQCADCHADVHQGQFAVNGRVDCARCHVVADFKQRHFDHDRDSRFPLDAQHEPLACDKCHKTYASPVGPVVRYKPLGTQCGDCHRLGRDGKPQGAR